MKPLAKVTGMPPVSASSALPATRTSPSVLAQIFPAKTLSAASAFAIAGAIITGPAFLSTLWSLLLAQLALIALVRGVPAWVAQRLFHAVHGSRASTVLVNAGSSGMIVALAVPVGMLVSLKGAFIIGITALFAPGVIHDMGIDLSPAGWLHTAERLGILGLAVLVAYFLVVLPVVHGLMKRSLPALKAIFSFTLRKAAQRARTAHASRETFRRF